MLKFKREILVKITEMLKLSCKDYTKVFLRGIITQLIVSIYMYVRNFDIFLPVRASFYKIFFRRELL